MFGNKCHFVSRFYEKPGVFKRLRIRAHRSVVDYIDQESIRSWKLLLYCVQVISPLFNYKFWPSYFPEESDTNIRVKYKDLEKENKLWGIIKNVCMIFDIFLIWLYEQLILIFNKIQTGMKLAALRSRSRWSRDYLRPGARAEIIFLNRYLLQSVWRKLGWRKTSIDKYFC